MSYKFYVFVKGTLKQYSPIANEEFSVNTFLSTFLSAFLLLFFDYPLSNFLVGIESVLGVYFLCDTKCLLPRGRALNT